MSQPSLFDTSAGACHCWLSNPPVLHEGHCCFMDDPTPLDEIVTGTPPPCGHWVEVP